MRIIVRMLHRIPCQTEGARRAAGCRQSHVVNIIAPPDESAELVALQIAAALGDGWTIVDWILHCPACAAAAVIRDVHKPVMGSASAA